MPAAVEEKTFVSNSYLTLPLNIHNMEQKGLVWCGQAVGFVLLWLVLVRSAVQSERSLRWATGRAGGAAAGALWEKEESSTHAAFLTEQSVHTLA